MAAEAVIRRLYAAIEGRDVDAVVDLVITDVFVLPANADAGVLGRERLIAELRRRFAEPGAADLELRVRSRQCRSGVGESARAAWVFDQVEVEARRDGTVTSTTPLRLTGLLVEDAGWRLAAAHWSIPTASNDEQRARLAAGRLPAGAPLEQSVPEEARALADALVQSLDDQALLPELYSTRDDAVAIGSTVDEIFLGPAGRAAWQRFVDLEPGLALRGGVRGALTPDGTLAWLATHIDISFALTTPYRFFFIWLLEHAGWKIVVSHDSVSMESGD